jgi:formate dehydrogenase subunit gamma
MGKSDKKPVRAVRGPVSGAGSLLSILHGIMAESGYIPKERIPEIAGKLDLSQAEVYGAITFYKDFRMAPPARHVIRVCQAESCMSRGAKELTGYLEKRLKIRPGSATPDNRFAIEPVYCFGNCACSPSVMIDGKLFGRVDVETLKGLIDSIKD